MMFLLKAAAGLVLSTSALACTYDEADQFEKLQRLADSVEGGEFLRLEKEVRWQDASGRAHTVAYGGCDHLGFKITRRDPAGVQLSDVEVLREAVLLARIPGWMTEDDILERAAETRSYTREESDGAVRFTITGTDYAEIHVESRVAKGYSELSFAWVRDF